MNSAKIAGTLFFVASSQFVLFLIIAEALYSQYSVSANYISDLGVGPSSIIFNTSVFILGLLILIGAYHLQSAFNHKILMLLLILTGIGAMGVGVFTEDYGLIHPVVSLITFLFGGLSAIASFKIVKFPFSILAVALGLVSLLALGLFGFGANLGLGQGGMERMIAYPILVWGAGFGGCLMNESTSRQT